MRLVLTDLGLHCSSRGNLFSVGLDISLMSSLITLEAQAEVCGMKKCHHYLLGLPTFQLVMDHKPLEPIPNTYTLDTIDNPHLQRLMEKLSLYMFTVT